MCCAETLDAGKLKEAAEFKQDEDLLIEIRDRDCVALEVKYHRSCYICYTKSRYKNKASTNGARESYQKSFNIFCETVINPKLIEKKKIDFLKTLFNKFVSIVKNEENEDASSYNISRFKQRIISRFPELVFCTPSMRNKSEIVFVEDLPHTSLLEHNISDYDNSEIEIEDNNDDSDTYMESEPETDPVPLLAHLHRAALYV